MEVVGSCDVLAASSPDAVFYAIHLTYRWEGIPQDSKAESFGTLVRKEPSAF